VIQQELFTPKNQKGFETLIAQNNSIGSWKLLSYTSPILPIHAALLNTGKVFFFCGSGNDPTHLNSPFNSYVLDLSSGNFSSQPPPVDGSGNPIDLFCAGQTFRPNGYLMIASGTLAYDPFYGTLATFLFNPSNQQLIQTSSLNFGRWYPTLLTLGSGRIFAISGLDQHSNLVVQPEIYSSNFNGSSSWIAFSQPTSPFPLYAHLFLLSNGQIFFSGANMGGSGLSPRLLTLPSAFSQAITETPVPGLPDSSNNQAASVLLPPAQNQQVMIIGGGDSNGNATNRVSIVDFTQSNPTYRQVASLNYARMHHSAVLLPDRTVFVCNGSQMNENTSKGVLPAEIYNPANGTWTAVATPNATDRVYHSIALLLPDGSVLTGGGNPNRANSCVANNQPPQNCEDLRLEIYSPPYMSQPRPTIQSAPSTINYGNTIVIQTPQAGNIQWVHLIKPMATTHTYDTEQRLVDLPIVSSTSNSLKVSVTNNRNLATPGYYMLFITDKNGIPSVASWTQLS
jgi:hypothetical protein